MTYLGRPDTTSAVAWALMANYLSIYLYSVYRSHEHKTARVHKGMMSALLAITRLLTKGTDLVLFLVITIQHETIQNTQEVTNERF